MYSSFAVVAKELQREFLGVYWTLVIPITLIVIMLELLKEKPAPEKIIRRFFIATLLLITFDYTDQMITYLGSQLTDKIERIGRLTQLGSLLEKRIEGIDVVWFGIKKSLIFVLAFSTYLLAYIGVFTAQAVVQFAWAVLYICSPFMIMAYISEKAAFVTSSLYQGLIHISLWKIMTAILSVLLLNFAQSPAYNDQDVLTVIIVNLCIAVSLLLVPFTVKSLLNNGLIDSASVMAVVPGLLAKKHLMKSFGKLGGKIKDKGLKSMKNNFGKIKNFTSDIIKGPKRNLKKSNVIRVDFKNKKRLDD